jgi:cellulose synthase/poly-beta-1,6-N-acetylglucosamine synthase-like glycosyltransferase
MQTFLAIIALACLGLVMYSYAIYPLLLIATAATVQMGRDIRYVLGKRDTRKTAVHPLPSIAVVISAFNEERFLQRRINNVLACEYPRDLLRVYIGSDGSSDATPQILSAQTDQRVVPHAFANNRGKASVLNDLVLRTTEEILVFSDANTFFEPDALLHLVGHFQNPQVGGVSGELRLTTPGGDNQDSLYWRVEQLLKFFEGRIGGLLGANGAIYAIRKTLWKPIAADTICDDFCIAMNVAAAGHRLVYDPNAIAQEETPHTISEEYHRRIRIGIGNFQALFRFPEYALRTNWATRFTYLSHKVLRWITPHLVLMALVASSLLAWASHAWLTLAALVLFGVILGYATYRLTHQGRRLPKILRLVAFFYALNEAFLLASWKYLRGDFRGSWRRTAR